MWTHLQPYLPNDRRAETIRRKARIGLWRAINMRRLILLVGSGATISLGQQSWNQTLIHFIALTTRQFAENGMSSRDEQRNEDGSTTFTRFPVRQIRLFDQIMELCGTEDVKHYSLGSSDAAKDMVRGRLAKLEAQGDLDTDSLRIALDLCEELLNVMDEVEPQPIHVAKVRAEFAKSFHSRDHPWENLDIDNNPVGRILKHTRSRRILTTNYDAEFERFLYESNLRSEPGTTAHLQFKRLPKYDTENSEPNPRRISVSSSLRRKISSTSIDAGNVGDLVNFAAYSRSELYQIFHLHGRLDHPMDMVVSKSDYRRVYAQDPSSAEAFQAAQEILFSGNDVLMVGFGGESDILLPFRRFVERGRKADQAPRRTFALLPSETGDDYKRKNATKAIDWALDYEIYTIHYGGKRFRETLGALKAIRNCLNKAWKTREEGAHEPLDLERALNKIRDFRIRKPEDAKTDSRGKKELVSDKTFNDLNALAADRKKSTSVGPDRAAWLTELRTLRNAAETETYTNAMLYELEELGRLSRDWWDALRHAPNERRARYHIADEGVSGAPGYLSVRHCSIWEPKLLETEATDWPQLNSARKVATDQVLTQAGYNRRIMRFAAPRGTGQATFANLLHRRENQAFIFDLPDGSFHTGGFLAHLSFSMEFTSVLKAFGRFFSYWTAKCLADPDAAPPKPASLAKAYQDLADKFAHQVEDAKRYLNPQSGQADLSLSEFERLRRLTKFMRSDSALKTKIQSYMADPQAYHGLALTGGDLTHAAQELVAVAWEDDQTLMKQDTMGLADFDLDATNLTKDVGPGRAPRRHRLDMLREAMSNYTAVCGENRLFVCLSGLDRIADSNGDAYNPAHRAFFRLLTGTEERTETNPFIADGLSGLPIDVVLIAGKPEAPIAYLSKEFDPQVDPVASFESASDADKTPLNGNVQLYSNRSATKRLYKRWGELQTLSWERRIVMLGLKVEEKHFAYAKDKEQKYQKDPRTEDRVQKLPGPEEAAAMFLLWAESTQSDLSHRDIGDLHETSQIHRLLYENLSLSLWVLRLWVFQAREAEASGRSPVPFGFHSFLRDLDATAARDGQHGVLKYVLDSYERVDAQRYHVTDTAAGSATYIPELHTLILRHLVVFALPVEPWVLVGCPLILSLLQKEFKKRCRNGVGLPSLDVDEVKDEALRQGYLARLEWLERVFVLRELRLALNTLVGRALVMRVHPASDVFKRAEWDDDKSNMATEAFLHTRYSLHNKIRQFVAHSIRLGVHDGADINHHRMSIYCDQPRELPSPTQEHYALVRDILEHQIDLCRETLAAMFQIGHEQARIRDIMEGWDSDTGIRSTSPAQQSERRLDTVHETPEDRRFRFALARRIFAPEPVADGPLNKIDEALSAVAEGLHIENWASPDGVGGSFGRLHAVPQRLRAMFSVLQGSFAIGSLSRMTSVRTSTADGNATPFDAYGNWLRSLINAGASLDRTQLEFQRIFCGTTFQDRTTGNHEISGWLSEAPNKQTDTPSISRITAAEQSIRSAAQDLGLSAIQRTQHTTLRHPFYRDEIAWLYNERGLTALTQGNVFDALPLLQQASFIMSHRRVPESDSHAFHAAERRIQLNMGIALLERGSVAEAQRVLTDLRIGSLQISGSTPSEIKPFSELYLAVCDHIGGSFERAGRAYTKLQKTFSKKNQFRAVAITCRSHADLCRARGELDQALKLSDLAMKAASRSEQRDIEHLCTVSSARVLIELGQSRKASPLLDRAMGYARTMGLPRIEIDAKIALSELMNNQGDYTLAGQFASEAVALSVENGLRLRKLSALFSYALSRRNRGSDDFAKRLLTKVASEAEELGYMTIAGAANTEMPT
ncbi:SIR2 family protein [Tateyamaria omphalii]|uniref:SIR2 family protein n=1 Tax=Tateyamaria omphalii TaxID=299262 RepID=UPI001C992484|nr:SIR2 family protein [Tateyamaria omphalii]MBY5933107.1 SIR2 family protein [Tateyamaria omphalii]